MSNIEMSVENVRTVEETVTARTSETLEERIYIVRVNKMIVRIVSLLILYLIFFPECHIHRCIGCI